MKKNIFTIFISLLLFACQNNSNLQPLNNIFTKKWIWEKTEFNNDTEIKVNTGKIFSIQFDMKKKTIIGTTDCNVFSATFDIKDKRLNFGNISTTRKYCKGLQEKEFIKMLSLGGTYMRTKDNKIALSMPMDTGTIFFYITNK